MVATIRYQRWLRGLVDRPGPSFDILFDIAWVTDFKHSVPNDDNRAEDGLKLREAFELETSLKLVALGECRVLELLIALAIRLNESVYDYHNPDQTTHWFWKLIENLEIHHYDGVDQVETINEISATFERLNYREYNENGTNGGLFPLISANEDQRNVEIWYQMMAYLRENP